ncbi:MAG: DUF4430 domain-containing protein [Peptococcaceae bacterium]|nr:DUF4430 domain-containing protein [Peptococcaceae bacterium]
MKNTLYFRKTLTVLLTLAMLMALFAPFAFAGGSVQADSQTVPQENDQKIIEDLQKAVQDEEGVKCPGTWVTVRILGYEDGDGGVILDNYRVRLTDETGYTVLNALEKACDDKNISLTVFGSGESAYVYEIGGQEAGYFQPNENYYSGWMYRVWRREDQPAGPQNDILPPVSAGAYTLGNGDKVTWYYAIPAESWYTIMDNYGGINLIYRSGQTINVNVKGQKFEDVINWNLTPFTGLEEATVTLVRAIDGAELASAVTDGNGDAALTAPGVRIPTLCYISVKGKYFTSGNIAGGIEQTASWRKPVIIIR